MDQLLICWSINLLPSSNIGTTVVCKAPLALRGPIQGADHISSSGLFEEIFFLVALWKFQEKTYPTVQKIRENFLQIMLFISFWETNLQLYNSCFKTELTFNKSCHLPGHFHLDGRCFHSRHWTSTLAILSSTWKCSNGGCCWCTRQTVVPLWYHQRTWWWYYLGGWGYIYQGASSASQILLSFTSLPLSPVGMCPWEAQSLGYVQRSISREQTYSHFILIAFLI